MTKAKKFIPLFIVLLVGCGQQPHATDTSTNVYWKDLRLQTIEGEVVTLTCPQREYGVTGAHSVDCYLKLKTPRDDEVK